MSESASKANILSNFAIFSKNKLFATTEAVSSKIPPGFNLTYAYISFVMGFILICLVFFYQRGPMEEYDWMPNINMEKWWLSTHLNSAGELASTYVPNNFLQTSGDDVLSSLQL